MTMTSPLGAELAERIRVEASRRAVQAEDVILATLDRNLPARTPQVAVPPTSPVGPPADKREWHRMMDEFEAEFEEMSRGCPEILLEALRRENMYADEER